MNEPLHLSQFNISDILHQMHIGVIPVALYSTHKCIFFVVVVDDIH